SLPATLGRSWSWGVALGSGPPTTTAEQSSLTRTSISRYSGSGIATPTGTPSSTALTRLGTPPETTPGWGRTARGTRCQTFRETRAGIPGWFYAPATARLRLSAQRINHWSGVEFIGPQHRLGSHQAIPTFPQIMTLCGFRQEMPRSLLVPVE